MFVGVAQIVLNFMGDKEYIVLIRFPIILIAQKRAFAMKEADK